MSDTPQSIGFTPSTSRKGGSVEDALRNGRKLLASNPSAALTQAQTILRSNRTDARALRLAGAAHRALGENSKGERAEIAAIAASERDPALRQIAAALGQKDYETASRMAADHLSRYPDDLAALTMSAESAIALGVADKAEGLLNIVRKRAPSFPPAQMLAISALIQMDRLRDTKAAIKAQIKRQPDRITHYQLLHRVLSEAGEHIQAVEVSEQIIALPTSAVEDQVNYGDSLRFSGRKADAIEAYRKAIESDPLHGRAWWSLCDLDVSQISDDDVATMELALEQRASEPDHAGNLHFALGMALDDRAQYARAISEFDAGNAMRQEAQPYDFQEQSKQVDRWLEQFPNSQAVRSYQQPEGADVPIFILGLPRSGSTLLERILGMHSQIEALGELAIMPNIVKRLGREQAPEEIERRIANLTEAELAEFGGRYLARASERKRSDKPYFVDKLHMNWKHLPLILQALPKARLIDLRRNPLDCCWSNYKTLFARGHPAASNLSDLGHFFRDYVRLADHFRGLAPDRVMLLKYETLIEDFEPTVRSVFDFAGLPFEEACLDFHQSQDPVATASSEQVRKPLNRKGIGTWKPYDQWLDPLRGALGDVMPE